MHNFNQMTYVKEPAFNSKTEDWKFLDCPELSEVFPFSGLSDSFMKLSKLSYSPFSPKKLKTKVYMLPTRKTTNNEMKTRFYQLPLPMKR